MSSEEQDSHYSVKGVRDAPEAVVPAAVPSSNEFLDNIIAREKNERLVPAS